MTGSHTDERAASAPEAGPAGRRARRQVRGTRVEALLAAVGALAVVGLYVVDAAAHGALGIARNDDWVYYRTAFAMAQTGRLSFDPYTSTLLLGQVLGAQPVLHLFGPHPGPLQLAVALLSAVMLAASYLFVRRFLGVAWSLLCVGVLAVGPIWGGLSVSFMSDVPAAALQVLALTAAVPALRGLRVRWGWLAASLALGLLAFSVREYSVAAVVAIGTTALLTHGRRAGGRRVVLGLGAVLVGWAVLALALFAWRDSLVRGPRALGVALELDQRIAYVAVGLLTTTGFLLFPVALAVWRGGAVRSLWRWWPLAVGLVAALTYTSAVLRFPLILGNYVTAVGSYSGALAGRPPTVFHEHVWWALQAVADVSTALLLTFATARTVGVVRRHRAGRHTPSAGAANGFVDGATRASVTRPRDRVDIDPAPRLALSFGVSTLVLTALACIVTHARPFDRYVVVALPFLAAAALHAARRSGSAGDVALRDVAPRVGPSGGSGVWQVWRGRAGHVVTAGGLAVLALVGAAQVDASATIDGAKWALGQEATRLGYAPETVDAGYEWFGLHQSEPVVYDAHRVPGFSSWTTTLFADARVCVNGEYAPHPVRTQPYDGEVVRVSRTSLFGVDYVLIGRTVDRGCDRPVAAAGQDGRS
ncbi:MAG: Dolichyl-phosphate-mannose-protein mannosyltransferase [Humibacillus sp.]|nr:Dolichyl-phosphate-mannose-protein mannosyltransferase [Humibacillus sp.]